MKTISTTSYRGHTVGQLITAFSAFDCEFLAAELAARFDLGVVVVGDSDSGAWHHALTYDYVTGLYIDITGVKTADQVQADWEGWDGWDAIIDIDDLPAWDLGERERPEVDVEAGIEMVLDQVAAYGISLTERFGNTDTLRKKLGLDR